MSTKPRITEQRAMSFVKKCINQDTTFFGVTIEEIDFLRQQLQQAIPNQSPNKFPDFYIPHGFVEHFQITSSRETSKGAAEEKISGAFHNKVNQQIQQLQPKWEGDIDDFYHEQSWMQPSPEHNHANLLSSVIKNWNDHIDSFNQYTECKNVTIFLLDYHDRLLKMHQKCQETMPEGCQWGDLPLPQSYTYRLSRDKETLQWIYDHCQGIQYVLFTNLEVVECIKVENIPFLIAWEPRGYYIHGCYGGHFINLQHYKIPRNSTDDEIAQKE